MNKAHPLAWRAALTSIPYHYRVWLQDSGSLTRRIQDRCVKFCVKRVFQSLSRIYGDEQSVMGLRTRCTPATLPASLWPGQTPEPACGGIATATG